jgi:hypothetical protein
LPEKGVKNAAVAFLTPFQLMFSKIGTTYFGGATDRVPMHSQPLKILAEDVKCEVALVAHRSTGLNSELLHIATRSV